MNNLHIEYIHSKNKISTYLYIHALKHPKQTEAKCPSCHILNNF